VSDRFLFLGRLCLDLAHTGTIHEGWRASGYEVLHQPSDLGQWLAEGCLGLTGLDATEADLASAIELREALWLLVEAVLEGEPLPAGATAIVNAAASRPDLAPELVASGAAGLAAPTVQGALATVARDAVHLFGDLDELGRLRECASSDCQIVFYDGSRPGHRRWCSANRCGNRLRARAYRARHH
jgi:predicted RNA-binding Zn ribbon-like protein